MTKRHLRHDLDAVTYDLQNEARKIVGHAVEGPTQGDKYDDPDDRHLYSIYLRLKAVRDALRKR